MLDTDKSAFKNLVIASISIYQQEVTNDMLRLWWAALQKFEFSQVSEAFGRHLLDKNEGKFSPKPAHIIAHLEAMNPNGRIGAQEAWALYPHNEASSAVITDEIAEAMQIAQPLMNDGDKIGARMSFIEAYNRITENNKFIGKTPKWFPSLGHSKEGRDAALKLAVEKGRISEDHAISLLPAPLHSNVAKVIGSMQLLTSNDKLTPEQQAKNHERILKIQAMLTAKNA